MVQRRLVGLVREAPLQVALTVGCALGAMAAAVTQWFLTAAVVADVLAGARLGEVAYGVAGVAAAVVCRALLLWLRDLCGTWTGQVVKRRLRDRLVVALLRLGPAYTSHRRTGEVVASLGDGVEALRAYVGFYLPQALVALAGPAVLAVALLALDPYVGAVVVVCLLALPFSRRLWAGVLGRRGRAHWEAYEEYAASLLDAIVGMATLRTLGATHRYEQRLRRDAARLYRATRSDLAASLAPVGLTAVLVGTGTVVSVVVGAFRVADGALEPVQLLLVLFLAGECFRPQQELQNYWHEGFYGLAASHGIFSLLDEPQPLDEPARPRPRPPGPLDLEVRDLRYRYPGGGAPALDGVSLRVPAGATVAVVGSSGAGKSTLVSLLQRFLDPDEGAVLVGGVDLRDLALAEARSTASLVSQEVHLFAGTVADNLRVASPHASEADLVDACRRARIHDTVVSWPQGYDTVLGERGATISGGERQRLAVARALLVDAPVLLLDEATSSVDGANEQALHAALTEAGRGRTTLVVAHRMSTVLGADEVVVLERGRVVQQGPPDRLLADPGGRFARLVAVGSRGAGADEEEP